MSKRPMDGLSVSSIRRTFSVKGMIDQNGAWNSGLAVFNANNPGFGQAACGQVPQSFAMQGKPMLQVSSQYIILSAGVRLQRPGRRPVNSPPASVDADPDKAGTGNSRTWALMADVLSCVSHLQQPPPRYCADQADGQDGRPIPCDKKHRIVLVAVERVEGGGCSA